MPPKSVRSTPSSRGNSPGSGGSAEEQEAIKIFLEALHNHYGGDAITAKDEGELTRKDCEKVWTFVDESKKGAVPIKPDFVKWLANLGVAPQHGKVLIPLFEPQANKIAKGKFVTFVGGLPSLASINKKAATKAAPAEEKKGKGKGKGAASPTGRPESGKGSPRAKRAAAPRGKGGAAPSTEAGAAEGDNDGAAGAAGEHEVADSDMLDELDKILSAGKQMEGIKDKFSKEMTSMKSENSVMKQQNEILTMKLRGMLGAIGADTSDAALAAMLADTTPAASVPADSQQPTKETSAAGARRGAPREPTGAQKLAALKSGKTLPSLAQREAPVPEEPAAPIAPQMTNFQQFQVQQAAAQQQLLLGLGSTLPAIPAGPDPEMIKQVEELRKDLMTLRTELELETKKRAAAEAEGQRNLEKCQDAERRMEMHKKEREVHEAKSRELQRCLEIMQEDLNERCRDYEKQLDIERNRVLAQHHMQQKVIRLEQILPKHLVLKSFQDDDELDAARRAAGAGDANSSN